MSEIVEGADFIRSTSISGTSDDIIKLGGSFDKHHSNSSIIEDNSDDDDDDIVNHDVNVVANHDSVLKKAPQRLFLTRRLSGMPVLPSTSFDSFDKTVAQNNVDEDVLAKLNELIDAMPNAPTVTHSTTQNPATITSTVAAKVLSVGWGNLRGFASNLIGGKK